MISPLLIKASRFIPKKFPVCSVSTASRREEFSLNLKGEGFTGEAFRAFLHT
jgi:hypothetical protein